MMRYIIVRLFWTVVNLFLIISVIYLIIMNVMNMIWFKFSISDFVPRLLASYFKYISGIITKWDWGISTSKEPVWETFLLKIPYTLRINLLALVIYTTLGVLLGIIASINKNKLIDNFISGIIVLYSSMHSLILIFLLMVVFGYSLGWLPTIYPADTAPIDARRLAYVIPIIALSLLPIAEIAWVTRGELTE